MFSDNFCQILVQFQISRSQLNILIVHTLWMHVEWRIRNGISLPKQITSPKYKHQRQQIIIAKLKQFLFLFYTCPSICLKDLHLFPATDHHRKVQTLSPSLLDLSINLFEGRTSVCSNRSSSQTRKEFLLLFSTCPSMSLKDGDPPPATDHHRKV